MSLSILIWLPLAGAVVGLVLPARLARFPALLASLGALGLSIALIVEVTAAKSAGLHDVTDKLWIKPLGVHYALGVDGLNVFLVALTTLLFSAALAWCARTEWSRQRSFYLYLGVAQSAVLGALLAQDVILFVAFFDLMLIPFFFLAGMWGGKRNPDGSADAATVSGVTKMVIYTMVGSLLMLAAAIAAGVLVSAQTGNPIDFTYHALRAAPLSTESQEWIFLFFAAAFLVKMPQFPLHGWMPDGYRAMPLPVLAVFSGVLSKVAAYGFLRIVLPIFPAASVHFQDLMLVIALASIIYGSALAFTTTNVRLVLGYSSVAQLGFIVFGIFSLQSAGDQGALLQSLNHGLVVAPMFLIVALLAARAHGSEDLRDLGGIALRAPVLATLFLIVSFALLAMPGSSNFVGEFLILLGVFKTKIAFAVIAFTGVGMAAVYALRLFIRAMHNREGPDVESRELSFADGAVIAPLVLVILALALYPQFALHRGDLAVQATLQPVTLELNHETPTAALLPSAPGAAAPRSGATTP
jgi:NADH-quinone oxidoreductase subunit M